MAILLAAVTQEARRGGAGIFSFSQKKNRRPGGKKTTKQRK
jgi:hypothetical protein